MSTSHTIRFTVEDYKSLTASSDQRYELIDGYLYMTPSPSVRHQTVLMNLIWLLESHARVSGSGRVLVAPLDVVLARGEKPSVVQPDLLFISSARMGLMAEDVIGAPDLIVEILSPSTARRDAVLKKALYARSGVREYWIVDIDFEIVDVCRLGADGYDAPSRHDTGGTIVSTVVSGLEIAVAEVFRDLISLTN
jgi:Uma2 family endonuclease